MWFIIGLQEQLTDDVFSSGSEGTLLTSGSCSQFAFVVGSFIFIIGLSGS